MNVNGLKYQHPHDRPSRPLLVMTLGLLLALTAGTVGTMWLIYEVHKEQKAIGELLRQHTQEAIDTLAPFPEELRWQFALTVLLLGVLVASAIVLVLILRGYLSSQQSLRDLTRQSADILESMEHGVLTSDLQGRIISANREAERLLGLLPGHVGTTLESLDQRLPNLGLTHLARNLLAVEGTVGERPFSFLREGHPVHLVADGHRLRDEAGAVHGTVLHLRDVTERQLIRERMRRMEGYMGLGPVAAGLQHEIKNPLGALSLHLQLLNEKLANGETTDVHPHLNVLKIEIGRIAAVLESFRDYADAGVMDRTSVDLRRLIDHAVQLVAPQAEARQVRFRVELRADLPEDLEADDNRLRQVLLNLLLNALEAMNRPGEISVRARRSEGRVLIEVADQGPGISPAARDHLFDPYFTTKKQGLGMGLAVCRKIARLHNGDLDFESGPTGALFRLALPDVTRHASV